MSNEPGRIERAIHALEMAKGAVAYDMGCLVSLPPNLPPQSGWPILVFLHGCREAAPLDLEVAMTLHGPLRARHQPQPIGSGSGATRRFVIIALQLPSPGGDVWKERANEVAAIACSAVDTYEGNRSQIYLTGFSYGGNGVLDIGSLRTDVWAALWPVEPTRWEPVDPKLNPVNIPDQPIWVSAGERARKNHASFTGDWSTVDMDWNYPVPNPHRVYEDKGLNHPDTATEAYRNPYIYNWLLTHSLP